MSALGNHRCRYARKAPRVLLRNTFKHIKGLLVLGVITVSTFFWFVPIVIFTLFKFAVPNRRFRALMTRGCMAMGENWISINSWIFGLVNSTQYTVTGADELRDDKWYLVVVNHQTWVDVIALQTAFNRKIPFLKFLRETAAHLVSGAGPRVLGDGHALYEAPLQGVPAEASRAKRQRP